MLTESDTIIDIFHLTKSTDTNLKLPITVKQINKVHPTTITSDITLMNENDGENHERVNKVPNSFGFLVSTEELALTSGIPESLRGKVWAKLASVSSLHQPEKYQKLVSATYTENRAIFEVIDKDLGRCFPEHVVFKDAGGYGQTELGNTLKSYALYNADLGYCQGMHFLAGMMLLHSKPEDTFWLLVATVKRFCDGFFNETLSQIRVDVKVFEKLMRKKLKKIYKKMVELEVDPLIFLPNWFLTFFIGPLPWETCLRVWDIIYCDGVKSFFRVALAILKINEESTSLLTFLTKLPKDSFKNVENFIRIIFDFQLKTKDILDLRNKVVKEMEK
ncbi:hypothetical protein HK099_000615 [Clydaea vesicula]|uniref:Rab-GAP TBC domain-containing protein n=1 Tax=Clydaea vesicula TaxID=447962 RepID=A0AAD5U5J4_9FUNG|nr:hypothetical protein HK099_000615 [Clydaea vesicula]